MMSYDWTDEQRAARHRAIAINAVREARLLTARNDSPWTDDDARRCELIYGMLFVENNLSTLAEHYPLVPEVQAKPNHVLDMMEAALNAVPDEVREAEQQAEERTRNLKVPKTYSVKAVG